MGRKPLRDEERKRRKRVTIGEAIQILRRIREGATIPMVADEMGIHPGSVSYVLEKSGRSVAEQSTAFRRNHASALRKGQIESMDRGKREYVRKSGWPESTHYVEAAILNTLIRKGITTRQAISESLNLCRSLMMKHISILRKKGWIARTGGGGGNIYYYCVTAVALSEWKPINPKEDLINDQG